MELAFLPADLARWDQTPAAELFAVPVFRDVRPLRGAAGLIDWRLCGQLSGLLRERNLFGEPGETLVLPGGRLPWRAVLAFGVGEGRDFSEARCREALDGLFAAMQERGDRSVALVVPGRELGRIPPDRALAILREAAPADLKTVTVVDSPAGLKAMAEAALPIRAGSG